MSGGVTTEKIYRIKKVNTDYFSEVGIVIDLARHGRHDTLRVLL